MNIMSQNRKIKTVVCLLAAMLLPLSCTDQEGTDNPDAPSFLQLSLSLAIPHRVEADVRTAAEVNGITVADVRVLQFAAGEDLKNNLSYNSVSVDADTGLPSVTTEGTDFDDISSRFYIVINTGETFKNNITGDASVTAEACLKTQTLECTGTSLTTAPQVMTYGPYNYTSTAGTGVKKALQLLARMQHIGAKLVVSWKVADGVNIEITAAEVLNVPDKYFLYQQESASAVSTTYLSGSQPIPFTDAVRSENKFTFYMPENPKGTGTGTTQQEKSLAGKGPGGSLDGCTCIVLKGTYKYESGDADPVEVEYHFYPGLDMVNNYDVERGKVYILDITLGGANSADARVRITDGNVFGIGDTDDVDHTIIF